MILQGNLDKSWIQERRKEFEVLLDFANAEILVMEAREMATLTYDCSLFEGDRDWGSFILKSTSRDPLFDSQDLARKKEALLELQGHLKEKLEKILWAMKTSQQTPILKITGTTVFTAHPSKDRFLLDLKEGDKEANSLKKEKVRLDFRLVDLARILGLKPGRFKRCLRLECGRIFYQSSSKERVYCSTKCSAAYRQSEFQKKKKEGTAENRDLKGILKTEGKKEVIDELKNE